MYRLNDIAEKTGMSIEEAEAALKALVSEREALGLANDVMLVGDERIYPRQ
jgi:hypothetical protein